MSKVQLYDTTLRDGSQREGISISVTDRLEIARRLDMLGIHYIEGGWPGANPRDAEFFQRARKLKLTHAKIAVFGSTRRTGTTCEEDANLTAILDSGAKVATIVGKTSMRHVTQVLECTPEENLAMIADSIRYLKSKGLVVFLDAEHFFDGMKIDANYSLKCLKVAAEAGAACNVLCDTNGGTLPDEITAMVKLAKKAANIPLGIHAHNDAELAVANTLAAVKAGATQVQGTINGYGERSGNANLCSIIPDLKLKMGIDCVSDEQLKLLSEVSHFVSEAANMSHDNALPYVGASAFAHKAGYHVSGISKWADAYQHIDPAKVGAKPHAVISDLSGKSNVIYKARERGLKLPARGEAAKTIAAQIKLLESRGFQYDDAEASFDLLIHRAAPDYKPPFELVDFMVLVENRRRPSIKHSGSEVLAEAMVKLKVGGKLMHTAAEGDGPVNALDQALRAALLQSYPDISRVKLTDYKVRILEESTGTESQVRVLIQSSDGVEEWRTVGSSVNIIEASWLALSDAVEYWLLKHNTQKQ
ncbi:MAG TPA: citramalate synthase [Dehalococcoidales bacterium]|nr:citramalate synthase [Dehalococcoidales bacterium]